MLADLRLVLSTLFDILGSVFTLYLGGTVLTGVLALWLLRKVSKLFNKFVR